MSHEKRMHKALDNLLMMWVSSHGYDWNCVDAALQALAASPDDWPITLTFAEKIESLRKKAA